MADIVRDVFMAFVRVHLLHHASEQPIYGLAMIDELARHGYRLSPGTLYPIFRGLEEAGFLRSQPVVVAGKVRKYYSITAVGRRALEGFKAKIRELVGEALYGARAPAPKSAKRNTSRRK
jgi:PadR family transcriptional regulator, regulatory protein PadR